MPLASLTRCRHLARGQASSPQVAPWLSRLANGETNEHRQRRWFISFCRCLGSHVGPLEAHRRLGKRHMTELMPFPTPTYTPLWHFELIGNPNEWQWQAPTTPQFRKEKAKKFSMEWVTNWLEASEFDKPFLDPKALTMDEPGTLPEPGEILHKPETIHKRQVTDKSDNTISDKLATLRTLICARTEVDHAILRDMRRPYLLLLRHRIRSGDFTVEEIIHAIHPLDDITRSHISENTKSRQPLPDYLRNLADLFEMKVLQSVITTVAELRADDPSGQYENLWRAIVADIGSRKPTVNILRAFGYLITHATEADRRDLPMETIVSMTQWLLQNRHIWWKGHFGPSLLIQDFGSILGYLEDEQQSLLKTHIEEWIQQTPDSRDIGGNPLYPKWLLVQASFMEEEQFMQLDFKHDAPVIHFNSIFLITISRMLATEHLSRAKYEYILKTIYASPARRWNALAFALVHDGDLSALSKAAKICERLGCNWIIGTSLLRSRKNDDVVPLIKQILVEADGPRHVIWAGIDRERKVLGKAKRQDAMKMVDETNPARPMTQLLEEMTKWLLSAPELTERQAFRGIERCVKTHKYVAGSSSPAILTGLVELSIRRMKTGVQGLPSRLDYLIRTVKEELGEEQASQVSMTLKRWYDVNRKRLINQREWRT